MKERKKMDVGVMFWAAADALAAIREAKSAGVSCGQLGIPGDLPLKDAAGRWTAALMAEDFTLVTVICAYSGESYSDIPAVERTVGFVPQSTRAQRETRTCEVSDFAAGIGVRSIGCHVGFVPEDRDQPEYLAVRDSVRKICDHAGRHGQTFVMETGQETAPSLLRFLFDVDRKNLGINFDPANMILYGTGDPIQALDVLAKHVISVHAKDGTWPPSFQPGALGTEVVLGQGEVGIERFVAKLKQIGFTGPLNVEREESDPTRRLKEVKMGVALLQGLLGKIPQELK